MSLERPGARRPYDLQRQRANGPPPRGTAGGGPQVEVAAAYPACTFDVRCEQTERQGRLWSPSLGGRPPPQEKNKMKHEK